MKKLKIKINDFEIGYHRGLIFFNYLCIGKLFEPKNPNVDNYFVRYKNISDDYVEYKTLESAKEDVNNYVIKFLNDMFDELNITNLKTDEQIKLEIS